MIISEFGQKNKDKTSLCVALGFFDSLHKGHAAIINGVIEYAKKNNFTSAVMTFENNPFKVLGQSTKLIYTFSERCELLKAAAGAADFGGYLHPAA